LHLVGDLFQGEINCCDTSQYNPAKKVLHIHTSFENTKYTIFLQLDKIIINWKICGRIKYCLIILTFVSRTEGTQKIVLMLFDNCPEVKTGISRNNKHPHELSNIHLSEYHNAVPTSKRTQSMCPIKTNKVNFYENNRR
jgi:hypothetical protein